MLGSICCMQTYFYLDEVSRHCQSYWQRSATRKMTGKSSLHYHSSQTKENKKDSHISFKDIDLLYHLMPSNTLALGLYERCILKRTFRHTTGFCRFREGERRRLSIGDNFLQQLRRSGVSRVCGEKVAAVRTEKLGTHTHTHSHTGRLLYPRYSPAAARVMKSTKCGPSPHSEMVLLPAL